MMTNNNNNNHKRTRLLLPLLLFITIIIVAATRTELGGGGTPTTASRIQFDGLYDLPAIQWACEPFLTTLELKKSKEYNKEYNNFIEEEDTNNKKNLFHPMQEKTKEICLKLRAGKLGGGGGGGGSSIEEEEEAIAMDENVTTMTTTQLCNNEPVEERNDEKGGKGGMKLSTSSTTVMTEPVEYEDEDDEDEVEEEKNDAKEKNEPEEEENHVEPEIESNEIDDDEAAAAVAAVPSLSPSTATAAAATTKPSSSSSSDDDSNNDEQNENQKYDPKYVFSIYQKDDGSETDPDRIPTRYMTMQNNKRDMAKIALEKTIDWRKKENIDTILARPHPKFDVSKQVFPHYFCGRDDTDHVILLQRPGLMNVKLAQKNDLAGEELLFHYVYVMEYLWRIIENDNPNALMTSIIDLTGLNVSILRKREQIRISSLFCSTMDAHFPQRSHRTLLINAPKWFGALYKIVSPLLRESTKKKIQILSKGKEQDDILNQLLSECPTSTIGTNTDDGTNTTDQKKKKKKDDDDDDDDSNSSNSSNGYVHQQYKNIPPGQMEDELRNFCLARLEDAGVKMQSVVPL